MEIYEGTWEELESSCGPTEWDWGELFDGRIRIAWAEKDYRDERVFLKALHAAARLRGFRYRAMKMHGQVAFQCPSEDIWTDEQVIDFCSAEEIKRQLSDFLRGPLYGSVGGILRLPKQETEDERAGDRVVREDGAGHEGETEGLFQDEEYGGA